MPFFWRKVRTAEGVTRVPYIRVYFNGTDRARSIRHLWAGTRGHPPARIVSQAEAELFEELERPRTSRRGTSKALAVGEEYLEWVRTHRSPGHFVLVDFTVRKACEVIERETIGEWTLRDIEEYLSQGRTGTGWAKKRRKWSARTYNLHAGMLSRFLSWAVKRKHAEVNPAKEVEKIREEKKQPQYIAEKDVPALLKACRKQDAELKDRPYSLEEVVNVALGTGARISELVALRWEDVDLAKGRVRIFPGKGKRERTIPISATAGRVLNKTRHRKTGPVFPGLTRDARPLRRAIIDGKLPLKNERLGWHLLRHTFGAHAASRGVPLRVLSFFLGHSFFRTTELYSHLVPSEIDGAMELIDKAFSVTPDRDSRKKKGGKEKRRKKQPLAPPRVASW